ncbi:YoaK family protein [Pigmentibacter sp. JX0631]|uniref:YoaK family protein n=1 Tax=Pigmentibacter sp. JX0631 TaxID=2976982 RepID=UPI0024692B20|nr:YoaK family protein [Pigmentibacter sp. JX0631]WGL60256.1 YoaK family protein [Pigmentibacter sp. JX0631]
METSHSKDNQESLILKVSRKLGLGSLLSFVAGLVNSVGFLGFGLFVSHVSGHATYAAVEYSKHYYILAITSSTAVLFFILGSASTAILMRGKTVEEQGITLILPVILEAILLFYVMFEAFYYSDLQLTYDSYGHANFFLVLSFAMGIQNATLRKKQGAHIRTTHMTGTATDIGSSLGTIFYLSFRPLIIAPLYIIKYRKLSASFLIPLKLVYSRQQIDILIVNLFTLLFFGVGAIIGTFGFIHFHFFILIVPIFILIMIAIIEFFIGSKKL